MFFSRFSFVASALVLFFLILVFVSGSFFVQSSTALWTLIFFSMMTVVFFMHFFQKALLFFLFSYVLALIGVLSFWHVLFAICFGFIFSDVCFRFFLKHHTPTADTISITLSSLGALAGMYGAGGIAGMYGFIVYEVSVWFLLVSAGFILIFSIFLFFLLIIISNYSKYGSLIKNLV
ncbi:MAG: hypothetical protein AAB362_02550 [Patescibacteria group bacterium]